MFQLPSPPDALPPQRGVKHYFIVQRVSFATIGIDPTSLQVTIYNRFLTWVPMICILVLMGPMGILAFKSTDELDTMSNIMAAMSQCFLSLSKFTLFMWAKKEMVQLVRKIWFGNLQANDEELKIISEENRYDYNVSLFYYLSVLVTATLAFCAPFIVAGFYAWKGYSYFESLDLPLKASYPLEPHKSYLAYACNLIWNIIGMYYVVNGTISIDTLFSWIMRNISAQFRVVNLRFTTAAENIKVRMAQGSCTDDEVSKLIIECVKYHHNVIELANQFDNVYRPLVFVKFVISLAQIATLTFQLSQGGEIAVLVFNISFMISLLTQVMLYCYGGQRIQDMSTSVHENIYLSFPWHELSVKAKKLLLLVMMRAQKPCNLTGIFFVADISLFVWVFRTGGSFMTMMLSVAKEE